MYDREKVLTFRSSEFCELVVGYVGYYVELACKMRADVGPAVDGSLQLKV